MTRALKIWLCVVSAALTVLVVSQSPLSRQAVAQQPPPSPNEPPPTPTPDPKATPTPAAGAACCEIMAVGGRTIGGPGTTTHYPAWTEEQQTIFSSGVPLEVCVTVENNSFRPVELEVKIVNRLRGGTFHRVWAPVDRRVTACGLATQIIVNCHVIERCDFRWRVDQAG